MKKQLLTFATLLVFIAGFSQTLKLKTHDGISEQFNAVATAERIPFNISNVTSLFGLDKNAALVFIKTEQDKAGFMHYRFYQAYNHIPIDKTMFIVHTKDGVLQSMSGTIVTAFDASIEQQKQASLSAEKSVSIAIANVAAKVYAWQDAGMEQRIKEQLNNDKATYYPKAELVYYNPGNQLVSKQLRLCYKVDVYALQPLSRADYFIDAATGRLLGKKDRIYFSDTTGTANTAWSSTQTIHSNKTATGIYKLRDYTRGGGVFTLHGETEKRGKDYTSASANWNLTGFDQAAMDAHYGVEQTYTYYLVNFGRNSYDNAGAPLYSYVNDPTYSDNAFWDGSAMNFNKRSTGEPGGVTGIDVTGHELTHGVTQETCNLIYSEESGAINESLSDIMGKSVQFFAKPTDINWQLSNDMNWIIRDMANPNALSQPDTYKGKYWYRGFDDNGGVHFNSGVGNFMFYLLVTGGSGTNDNGNPYHVSALGLSKADQIIYRSQTVYLTETSQYADWRIACVNAAADLYGTLSNEVSQVKNAFYAVGIGPDSTGCDAPNGLTANNITATSATLQWANIGGATGYNLQWKLTTSGNWSTVSNLTTNSYLLTGLTPDFSYDFRVQAKCQNGSLSAFTTRYSFVTLSNGSSYCASAGQSTISEYIQRVAFGNTGFTSGNNNGHANFTSTGPVLKAGKKDTLTLTPGYTNGTFFENWTAYIDYNQDGDFFDAGERIGFVSASLTAKLIFTVPPQAPNGTTRMRIQMCYESRITDPCAIFPSGEVEDYSAKITGGALSSISAEAVQVFNIPTSLSVAPNPVNAYIANASLYLNKQGPVTIKITDLSGRLLLKQEWIANDGINIIPLNNLNKLTNGVFIISAEQNGIVAGRSKFVIDR